MRLLAGVPFIPLDDIFSVDRNQRKEKIELFLDDLVRRGFVEKTGVAETEALPSITIIIPVYNQPRNIATCLDSLMQLDYPDDKLQIIVVDDASTDETPDAVYPVIRWN